MSSSSISPRATGPSAPPTSIAGSPMPSVSRAAVVTHGKPETIGDAVRRFEAAAAAAGVEVVDDGDADLVVVLGGDGTMLRALRRSLETGAPVFGINFGRVGFLTALEGDRLELGLARAFEGDYVVVELATLAAELGGERFTVVNDVVATSSTLGRMVELEWSVGGEELGSQACDGVIAATPLLRRLRIENLVLIREADLELGSGLNAITGETGAGKTILSQAIGLLLGGRGDVSAVG